MGLKLWEICANRGAGVIPYLLRKSDEGGGGDVDADKAKWAGRWAGDRILVVGDYDSSKLYQKVMGDDGEALQKNEELPLLPYMDISLAVRKEYEKFLGEKLGKRWDTIK